MMLCIAEKNSVAKQFATILSGGRFDSTKIQDYMMAYSFQMNGPDGLYPVVVIHGAGHAKNYQPDDSKLFGKDNFTCKISSVLNKYGVGLKNAIRRFAQQADQLILCQDNDREGEHIAWESVELFSECRAVNIYPAQLPRVRKEYQANIFSTAQTAPGHVLARRCRFSSLSQQELLTALQNLHPIDTRTVEAVDVRAQLDLRIGFSMSSLQLRNTEKLHSFGSRASTLPATNAKFTFGTCQTPTLGLCASQHPRQFRSTGYMELRVAGSVSVQENALNQQQEMVLFSQPQRYLKAVQDASLCLTQLKRSALTHLSCSHKETAHAAPAPPNTVELQKRLGGLMGVPQAMKIAESLYQQGYISYPRTETRVFPEGMNFLETVQMLRGVSGEVGNWAGWLLEGQGFAQQAARNAARLRTNKGLPNDESHPPIHPLKAASGLGGQDFLVYKEVCRLFLVSLAPDKITADHFYTTQIATVIFAAKRSYVKEPGWDHILTGKKPEVVPNPQQSIVREVTELLLREEKQAPEPKMTQVQLVTQMEKFGIGTDATIAEHISHVMEREFVDKTLDLTRAGETLLQMYRKVNVHFVATSFRAMMEAGLRNITLGVLAPDVFYKEIMTHAQNLYEDVNRFIATI